MREPTTTPTDEDVIRMAIEQRLVNLNVSMPGVVESFDKATQTASIQPALKRKYSEGEVVNLPVLQKVPVVFPRGSTWSVTGPIVPGDTGHIIFSQRSIDVWKKDGGVVDPKDPRKFHITDAIFYPGLGPSSKALAVTDHLTLTSGSAKIELQKSGKFRFEKTGGDELLDLLIQITTQLITVTDKLSTDMTNTMMGPQPLLAAADYAAAKSALTQLKNKITAIKG